MEKTDTQDRSDAKASLDATTKRRTYDPSPRRDAPYDIAPGYYEPARLWLYGNVRLLDGKLACVSRAFGPPTQTQCELEEIEAEAERIVLGGQVIVCGVHNEAHKRSAVVPLRWGAPRVLVVSGGFKYHLGDGLDQEPFRAARLWRYKWDRLTDLIVSRRAPDRPPTYALYNPTVDRLVAGFATTNIDAACSYHDPFGIAAVTRH
jgi:hypothetical protein